MGRQNLLEEALTFKSEKFLVLSSYMGSTTRVKYKCMACGKSTTHHLLV